MPFYFYPELGCTKISALSIDENYVNVVRKFMQMTDLCGLQFQP